MRTASSTSRTIPEPGLTWVHGTHPVGYRLYACVPRHAALNDFSKRDAAAARYVWRNPDRPLPPLATVDQEQYGDEFVYLGQATLAADAQVFLGDNVGAAPEGGTWVLFGDIVAVPSE
jgi:hypothetical protein